MLLWLLALLFGVVHAAERASLSITSLEQAEQVDDPRTLLLAGRHLLEQGNSELARALFEKAVDSEELSRYLKVRPELREALILEHEGRFDEARAQYGQGIADDVLYAILVLRIASNHPDREAIVSGALEDVRARVERARAGQEVSIYTTKSGGARNLVVLSDDEARTQLLQSGELSYCYVDTLDLSAEKAPVLPPEVVLNRCIIGSIRVPDRDLPKLVIKSIVLGDTDIGKTWAGEPEQSAVIPASRLDVVNVRNGIFLGRFNFQEVHVSGRRAMFPVAVFDGPADFRDAVVAGFADFRFAVFGAGANFKGMQLQDAAYFGHSRYRKPTTFRGMWSQQDVFFDSTTFEDVAVFDRCEWSRGATFENAVFRAPVSFNSSKMGGRLNMSRAVFEDTLTVSEMELYGMDLMGAHLTGDAAFIDVHFGGKVRFSLDEVSRATHLGDPTPLLPLYRDYQGDKDAAEPLTTRSSYGVVDVDDLIARVEGDLRFDNSSFDSFCVFERVVFGTEGRPSHARFFNTQFSGETHFERTVFHSVADFTTIFGNEISFNEAHFDQALILDDAYVLGRVTLTDAEFVGDADLSFYGAEIRAFQIQRDQVEDLRGEHRMFYERCALGDVDRSDPRMERVLRERELGDQELKELCYDRVIDEFILLKQSFDNRAQSKDEDWAYWWLRHHQLFRELRHGGFVGKAWFAIAWPLFEICFGWGVRLENLAIAVVVISWLFALLYRKLCPYTVMDYHGRKLTVSEVPFSAVFYISLQALLAINTAVDFMVVDHKFRFLNTLEAVIGFIILTFFVGAYTRMILF